MSRAGSGFLCSLINNHPLIFMPHFDNTNQGFVYSIIKKGNLSFKEKKIRFCLILNLMKLMEDIFTTECIL